MDKELDGVLVMDDTKFNAAFAASGLPSQFKRAFEVGVQAYLEATQAGDSEVTKYVENAMRAGESKPAAATQTGESEAVAFTVLQAEIDRLRPHYQSLTAHDVARRQMLNHFEKVIAVKGGA